MKVAVTGANKGIGQAAVLLLLADPAVDHVYFTARDEKLAEEALKGFKEAAKGKKVDYLLLDILAEGSVCKFVAQLKEKKLQFDVFINNAGVFLNGLKKETLDTQFRVNYTFPIELTHALIKEDLVKKGGRFVYTSSGMGNVHMIKDHADAVKLVKNYKSPETTEKSISELVKRYQAEVLDPSKGWGDNLYAHSKMFLTITVHALAKENKDFTFFVVCPGFVATTMTEGMGATRTPAEGADTIAYIATAKLAPELNGEFFNERKVSSIL